MYGQVRHSTSIYSGTLEVVIKMHILSTSPCKEYRDLRLSLFRLWLCDVIILHSHSYLQTLFIHPFPIQSVLHSSTFFRRGYHVSVLFNNCKREIWNCVIWNCKTAHHFFIPYNYSSERRLHALVPHFHHI